MNKGQFFEVMNGVDDDLIENFLNIPVNRIVITRKPHYLRTALSTAAAVGVLAAGIFGVLKLRGLPHSPNSGVTISAGNSSDSSEPIFSDNSSVAESGAESDTVRESKLERVFTGEPFSFNVDIKEKASTGYAVKDDDENYAVVRFKMLSYVYPNKPLYIDISTERKEGDVVVGRAVIEEDNGGKPLVIEYAEKVEKGERLYLTVVGGNGNTEAAGQWLP